MRSLKGVSRIIADGSQIWVTPLGFSTSTLAVTSNIRHLSSGCTVSAKTGIDFVNAKLAQIAPLDWRKLRRFISSPRKKKGCLYDLI